MSNEGCIWTVVKKNEYKLREMKVTKKRMREWKIRMNRLENKFAPYSIVGGQRVNIP